MFRENVISPVGQAAIVFFIMYLAASSLANIAAGRAPIPEAFALSVFDFALFAVAKFSVIRPGTWLSFGTKPMNASMAPMYRFGYWLMIVGIVATFSGISQ